VVELVVVMVLQGKMDNLVEVLVVLLMEELRELEIPHQYHHHKEIMVGLQILEVLLILPVVEVALAAQVQMELVLLEQVVVETEQHLLFLEHQ
jgi:hypothetical protein